MEWQQFVMKLEDLNPDNVEAIFLEHGAQSVTFSDGGNRAVLEPAPGETPLWAQTCITGLFEADADLKALEADLKRALALDRLPQHHVQALADRDWEREWQKNFGPMRFGDRLWVCPGESDAEDADAVIVRLDPGLAFGTGTHATTAMCLEWLDGLDLRGRSLLDYGCGSGLLAIAALKLGCTRAHAIDIDVQAITATLRNAAHNGIRDQLTVSGEADAIHGQFDVVVANILASPLVGLAASLSSYVAPGGRIALSGILSGQQAKLEAAYAPWIDFDAPEIRVQCGQTWMRLTGRKMAAGNGNSDSINRP